MNDQMEPNYDYDENGGKMRADEAENHFMHFI